MTPPESPTSNSRNIALTTNIYSLTDKLTQHLNESMHSERWRRDAEKLLTGLEDLNPLLKLVEVPEKLTTFKEEIEQLCNDIDSAIAAGDRSFLSKWGEKIKGTGKAADLKTIITRLEKISSSLDTEIQRERNQAVPSASTGQYLAQLEAKVIEVLLKEDDLRVVGIWGKNGMGKTSLAKKVFNGDRARKHFELFAWVQMKRDLKTKSVLQSILLQLLPEQRDHIRDINEIQLVHQMFTIQKEKICLIVIDDIQAVDDWERIRLAFPISQSKSKILITARSYRAADRAASNGGLYIIKPLNEVECANLLKEEAGLDDSELQTVGKTILRLSGGSRLIVIILGKLFKATDMAARDKFLRELNRTQIRVGDETRGLQLCYERLTPELRSCLLYMSQFPNGHDIDVDKLSLLLEAERVIPEGDSVRNMLQQLALKSFIKVREDKVSITAGRYKSCRLEKKMRNFCISQALEENFFEIAEAKAEKNMIGPSTSRLVVYQSKSEDGSIVNISSSSPYTAKNMRSLLVFDTHETHDKSTWAFELNVRREFTHLRVLYFDGIDFRVQKLPRRIDKLVFLVYLSVRGCWLEALPSSISSLTFLETLDLQVTTDCKMAIPNHFFSRMRRLRHLYFPLQYESHGKNKLQLNSLDRLKTLVNFDTDVCQIQDLLQMRNLEMLAIISQGKPEDLNAIIGFLEKADSDLQLSSLDVRNFNGDTRNAAATLEKLVRCERLRSLRIEGHIGKLPKEDFSIPPNFLEIEFNGSELDKDLIDALGQAENLRSLVLSNDAFVGNEMSFSDESRFRKLKILKLLNLKYLDELTFEGGEEVIMPELSTLVIDKCDRLKKVRMPKELHDRLQNAPRKKEGDIYSVQSSSTITHGN